MFEREYSGATFVHVCVGECSYIVPELHDGSVPQPDWTVLLDRVRRCQDGIGKDKTVPLVAIGPISFVYLAKGNFNASDMVRRLIPAYISLLTQLKSLGGVPEVQVREYLFSCE